VGSKAYNCARLRQVGLPVPDGFAIPNNAMIDPIFHVELNKALNQFPEQTLFAVRSSASDEDSTKHSFAGIHETKLNVTRDGVAEAINACIASVKSQRAIAYRITLGLSIDNIKTGILVQEMIQPTVSGVAFTLNPVTGANNEMVINASWGLGEAIVSGQVEPDEFHLRKLDGIVLFARVGSKLYRVLSRKGVSSLIETERQEQEKRTLTDEQLHNLAVLLRNIEKEYGSAQDVEWCHDGDQFWILQSRAVTTRPQSQVSDTRWTRANAREVLPDLMSPQTLPIICEVLDRAMRLFYTDIVAPKTELGPVAKGFYGCPYFNLSQLLHINRLIDMSPAALYRQMGHEGEIRKEDELPQGRTIQETLRSVPAVMRILWNILTVDKIMSKQLNLVEEFVSRYKSRDYVTMSDMEVWNIINLDIASLSQFVFPTFPIMAGLAYHRNMIQSICEKVGFPPERLLDTQLALGEKSITAQQGLDLMIMANQARVEKKAREYFLTNSDDFKNFRDGLKNTNFLKEFDNLLEKYGHRGNFESEWALPRYFEDPNPLLSVIRVHIQAPNILKLEEIRKRQEHEANEIWHNFEEKMTWRQRRILVPRVRRALKGAKQLSLCRERNRFELARVVSEIRRLHLVLAERFTTRDWIEEPNDYFFLKLEEVSKILDSNVEINVKPIISRRKNDYEAWRNLEMPLVMTDSDLIALIRKTSSLMPIASISTLRGLNISSGFVEGEVIVITEPSEFIQMKKGAILVAPVTNPTWTPLFALASGVIVEIGGTLSHSSIVAREYRLPAIANVKDATKLLKTGDRVRLDADNETVEVLSHSRKV
jgi:pyruvate,water dikinase